MIIGVNAISFLRLLLLCMIGAISAAFGYRSIIQQHLTFRGHHQRALAFSAVANSMTPPHSGETILAMSEVEDIGTANEEKSSADMKTIARMVSTTQSSFEQCGQRLRDGKLVSFPTETVYGLGCHALDQSAVQKVFDAKERPLSDPLIVHVTKSEDALELWDASTSMSRSEISNQAQQQEIEKKALNVLTEAFFPGPLTLVARAHPSIPQILMANTGFVACRSPSHPIARALISAAKVPIAAPSANKFGHVSPTLAEHVMDDLGQEDVWIIDPTLDAAEGTKEQGGHSPVCQVGVESTVAKVEMSNDQTKGSITILRHGAISSSSIREALAKNGLSDYFEVSDSVRFTSEKVSNVAPGQTIKHYSPNVPCFMVDASRQCQQNELSQEEKAILAQSVIIDYGKRLSGYQQHVLAYRDLSVEGDASMAASSVFETLRWSERIQGANRVFVPDIILANNEDALDLAVKDKLTRAASAVIVNTFA
mmetsp:Transcript_27218/g.46256  ORF Transcript_27218/g.46256 Transcript_27218/m.46256 type:complete len:482 (-) Transcript_27218:813-2258(-)